MVLWLSHCPLFEDLQVVTECSLHFAPLVTYNFPCASVLTMASLICYRYHRFDLMLGSSSYLVWHSRSVFFVQTYILFVQIYIFIMMSMGCVWKILSIPLCVFQFGTGILQHSAFSSICFVSFGPPAQQKSSTFQLLITPGLCIKCNFLYQSFRCPL
jgi:hypothetical protein